MTFEEVMEYCYCVAILDLNLSETAFLDLTPYEFSILVEHNKKNQKDKYSILRNTIYNAGANLLRKKGEKEIKLFEEDNDNQLSDIDQIKKERQELFGELE